MALPLLNKNKNESKTFGEKNIKQGKILLAISIALVLAFR